MSEKYNYDLVIVGAGPAGSSAAFAAAKNGIKVALIEKENEIAETVRTSGVTWIESIKEFGIPDNCYNKIKNFSFVSPNNQVTISDSVATAAVLDVRKTYRWLADEAKKMGADIFLKTNINEVIKNEENDIVGVSGIGINGKIIFNSKVIIDATGFTSTISKAMGFVTQWKRFGAGAEYEAKVENVDSETWWLMVGQEYTPAGYAWIFPLGNNIVRIGVGVGKPESNVDPTQRLKEIIEKKLGPIEKLGKITPLEFHYGLIPNDGLSRKTVFNNLILVGDTAGQANPLVLEGIRYAIKFGRVAGEVASNAIKNKKTDEKSLYPYEENWRNAIESKISSAGKIQDRWIGLSDEQWDKELDIIKELKIEEFLDFIKADFGLSNIFKLAMNHPKLAVRQLFSLIKGK
ncbi:MAG: NAD(P)/FAD-dependent oxidoreductase [Candidatus Nitrosopumilus limneticus]|nr:NAD(P)/FAD-dependent oxidoreductase [Candidatus Nitrosopumilus limneticus]MSS85926.1 NAD(P)/FAD-dependent oxidoreductase [Nitrosopumilus sp.]PHY04522.1 MAG: geranylgeranyl reductase [Nitrososphaerota archaeon]MDC4213281.1 NAD(P)/FAD-dependent oxidoreductase [Candidatus Nitrosopumilus limneticus]MDC4214275.1 NAD(P)/FAD-dependent oxidoreductase [Candidatus Nitrosopumilus limneticus]